MVGYTNYNVNGKIMYCTITDNTNYNVNGKIMYCTITDNVNDITMCYMMNYCPDDL